MATIIPIGTPVNDSERRAIAHLRDNLPKSYLILHNFEIKRNGDHFEVDLAVIAPHAVYLVDIKGTHGLIDVYGPKWYPDGRQPYTSPLFKLRGHARSLKGVITDSQPSRRDLEGIYVDAVVLLTEKSAVLQDPGGRDAPNVTTLDKSTAFFQNAGRITGRFSKNIGTMHNMVLKALQGVAKPKTGALRFGSWEVQERLSSTDAYTEYRAVNLFAGSRAGTVLLRAYQADPYLPDEEREAERTRISNAYTALNKMPGHPGIVGARDFFATEAEDKYILVTEDASGQALKLHIDKANLALTLDQKLRIASGLLEALVHAHKHDVVHRNLSPSCILVGKDGRAQISGFDFARAGTNRSRTIAHEIVDELETAYMAPELHGEPSAASPGSDMFSAGLILYELFTGDRPFNGITEIFDCGGIFPMKPSNGHSELPEGFDDWLQRLCTFEPDSRPTAAWAVAELAAILHPDSREEEGLVGSQPEVQDPEEPILPDVDYEKLSSGDQLTRKYVVDRRLGKPGSFGVVYKVIDTLGDVTRAVKLILRDRHSTLDRLKKEYRTLLRIPEHPSVVKVIDADILPGGGPPFIVFDFIDGFDVGEMIDDGLFAPEDALELARQVVDGLVHLHRHGVYHCDIKPRNLLWTDKGAVIIDFNVSVLSSSLDGHGGGSRRYLPPDLDLSVVPGPSDLADRDLYALGLTLYESLTGRYPFDTAVPPGGKVAQDPREFSSLGDLSPELSQIMLKAISPKRADRYASAVELQTALSEIEQTRRPTIPPADVSSSWTITGLDSGGPVQPNTNPYVNHLLTLYSQSRRSNSGTRGLDAIGLQTYVETALDRELAPAVLAGEFNLVVISGNAGDGKTAFIQQLEVLAEKEGATVDRSLPNGSRFALRGCNFLTNYDGSQDEGKQSNDDVLRTFFAPYEGDDTDNWGNDEIRIIAINEGRIVDFLAMETGRFSKLEQLIKEQMLSGTPSNGVSVVNLNLRSVVVDPQGFDGSILERLIRRMTHEKFWEPCLACDLRDRCYAAHNAKTFQDPTAGPKIIERLKALYSLTHLRGRMHITLRDLRSALAYMLAGVRDCNEIHEIYNAGKRDEIIQGFYFNSWMGGTFENADRLLKLLKEVDVGPVTDPRLDRSLDFVSPAEDRSLFRFEERGSYDLKILRGLFDELPRDFSGKPSNHRRNAHSQYVEMTRRRAFFERRDAGWKGMLPYRLATRMLSLVQGGELAALALPDILRAINRGEGLLGPEKLKGHLALQVRQVQGGTIRSYRLFPDKRFSLMIHDQAANARFIEHMPSGLVLRYDAEGENDAELVIELDVFEMLMRLNEGYRPSVEEEQGYYLSLEVFKNLLASAAYQEVLLSTTGHDFYRVKRHHDGRLEMDRLQKEVV